MNRYIAGALTGILALATINIPRAAAQPQVPVGPSRPVFSPYLNLLGGGNPALNYFGIVVPQMQLQQQLGQVQQQQQLLVAGGQSTGRQTDPSGLFPPTGSVPVFNNTYGYFNRIYIGGGTGGGGGGGSATSGGAFNRVGGFSSSPAAGGASGFGRGMTGGSGAMQPSFAAPAATTTPAQPRR